jgi:hypothetical protein
MRSTKIASWVAFNNKLLPPVYPRHAFAELPVTNTATPEIVP